MKLNVAKIKLLMAKKMLSQEAAAKICGISASGLCGAFKAGECRPVTAGKLARGLGVQLEDIILEEG